MKTSIPVRILIAGGFALVFGLLHHATEPIPQQTNPERARIENEIRDFWADPRHPYAEEVSPFMVDLINRAHAKGLPTPSLEDVYQQACWMHPRIRALLLKQGQWPPVPDPGSVEDLHG
jgi:hypothetical protein